MSHSRSPSPEFLRLSGDARASLGRRCTRASGSSRRRSGLLTLVSALGCAAAVACSAPPTARHLAPRAQTDGGVGSGGTPTFGGGGNDPGTVLGPECASATATTSREPVYMLVVLDGSGSMTQDNKWNAVVPALNTFFDDLLRSRDTSFGVGLTVFSDTNDPTAGRGPYTTMSVPIGFVDASQSAALKARLAGAAPEGPTPTLAVLSGQYPLLDQFSPSAPLQAGGKKVLVLMSDGVPNGGPPEQASCVAAARSEAGRGVTTFAVGIGNLTPYDPTDYDPLFMAQMAVAGGDASPTCDPQERSDGLKMCHLQVSPGGKTAEQLEKDFVDAINRVRGAALSCAFGLDVSSADNVDPLKVNVVYTDGAGNDTVVPQSPDNGWTYDDPSAPHKVLLNGAACDAVRADPNAKIKIVLGCKTVVK